MPKLSLTSENIAFIKANRLRMTGTDMAKVIGVDKSVVNRYMRKNNLTPPKEIMNRLRGKAIMGKTNFTAEEDEYIRENYLKWPIKVLASKMGRSFTGITGRMKAMNLQIPNEIKKRNINAGRFSKEHVSFNKGKRQCDYLTEKQIKESAKHWFKKGNIPHNTKRDGYKSIRIDTKSGKPYIYIRISLSKWKEYHRYRWEMFRGKIPKGMCLWFKDGNTLNCKLSNLELITRAENMRRNSIHNYPEGVKNAIHILSGFNRKLNKIIKDEEHH